jgi:hypothetical protein
MFMSFYTTKILASDDDSLAGYLDDVEWTVGKPGIAEIVQKRYNWIRGHSSEWWLVQQEGIKVWP